MTVFDITDDTVDTLGPETSESQGLFKPDGYRWDYAIAGVPFLSASHRQNPFQRGLVQDEKPQIDTADAAGEQSFSTWWLRSQMDFSSGAGQAVFEPARDPQVRSRFAASQGVDVWGRDGFKLLPAVTVRSDVGSVASPCVVGASVGGSDYVVTCDGVTTCVLETDDSITTVTGLTGQPTWLWSTGRSVIACHATGIDLIDPVTATAAALWTGASATPKAWWVKQRIIATVGNSLYELPLTGGTWPVSVLYTHPDPEWQWSAVVETPSSILAAGYSGSKGAIYRFDLATDGGLPALTSAITMAELPQGETIHGLFAYLGAYVAIGTNKGVRIGIVNGPELQYGPLVFETTKPVEHFTGRDSYVWCGVTAGLPDGKSGLVRVDLSAPDDRGSFAWATDLATTTTVTVSGVTHFGASDRIVFGAGEVHAQSDTPVASGWLESSQIVFGTLEPKLFATVGVRGVTNGGTVAVSKIARDGTPSLLHTFHSSLADELSLDTGPVERCAVRFDLTHDGVSPLISGWQVKALPAADRKELISLKLLCFEREKNRAGVTKKHNAWQRFAALRDLVVTNVVVSLQILDTGETVNGQVKEFGFVEEAAPTGTEGFGGVINITLRVV